MLQPQTAPTTLLESTMQTLHQAYAAMTAALAGALQEGSPERMRLAVEHLQTFTHAVPPPLPSREAQIEDLVDAYAAPGVHRDYERIARVIVRWGYRRGCCYASQEKIARWAGLPKSTVQLRLEEMERDGFLQRTRRSGTSSVIILADGTLDALRLKKMRKIATRERTNPYTVRMFSSPVAANVDETAFRPRKKGRFWSKNTTCSLSQIATQSIEIEAAPVISAHSSLQATPEVISRAHVREKTPVTASEKPRKEQPKPTEKPQEKPAAISVTEKFTPSQNGKEKTRKAAPTSVSSHPEPTTAAKALIAEGVTPARARDFASLFGPERIARTIALGLHRTKANPPGYLLRLIQDDAASKRIVPGSEADRARKRERPAVQRGRIAPTEAAEARESVSPRVSITQLHPRAPGAIYGTFSGVSEPPAGDEDPLETLPPEERAFYAGRAREEVLRATPWLGTAARERNGPMLQALIRKQLRAMLAASSEVMSSSRSG